MWLPTAAAKQIGPAIVAPAAGVTAAITFDNALLIRLAAIVAGLAFGAMWRAASMRSDGKAWSAIRDDLAVSVMIGGANAVLVLAVVDWFGIGTLVAMAVGVLVGATGLRALPEFRDAMLSAARRKLLGDNAVLIQPRDLVMTEQLREIDKEDTR